MSHWPPGRGPRLLLADAWGTNTGDAAITVALVSSLRRRLPEARILVCQSHPGLVAPHYPGLVMTDSLSELTRRRPRLVAQADAVISQGGGFLFEHYSPVWRLQAHRRVLAAGLPLAFWAQSVGPFADPAGRELLRGVLERAAVFVARDPETLDHLGAMEIRPRRLELTADEALMLPVGAPLTRGETIGLTLTATAAMPAGAAAVPPQDGLVGRHAALAAALAEQAPLRALSTIQGLRERSAEVEDDGLHHRAVHAALPASTRERVELVEGFLPLERFVRRLDGLDVLVTARLHAAIIAMLHGIPSVYVSQNFKGVSLFERLGLAELVVVDADTDATLAAVERARELAPSLGRRIALLRRDARRTAGMVLDALGLT